MENLPGEAERKKKVCLDRGGLIVKGSKKTSLYLGRAMSFGVTYDDISDLTDVDSYWENLEAIFNEQREFFVSQLTLRLVE